MQFIDEFLTITYFIPISTFSVIHQQIGEFLEFWNSKEENPDVEFFEKMFKYNLERFYNIIEDEIKNYSK